VSAYRDIRFESPEDAAFMMRFIRHARLQCLSAGFVIGTATTTIIAVVTR